jgi:hypothetical protein
VSSEPREAIARILYNEVLETSDGYTEPIGETESMDTVLTIDGRFNFVDLADAVIAALGLK